MTAVPLQSTLLYRRGRACPDTRACPDGGRKSSPALVVLSAHSEEQLHERIRQLLTWIQEEMCTDEACGVAPQISDLAYTLQVGREAMEERLALQVSSFTELEEKLRKYLQEPQKTGDWYRGQVNRHKEAVALLNADEELQEAIGKWLQRGKYEKLLEWWVKGLKFDWKRLYGEDRPRRISLPTYPFARNRYWLNVQELIAEGKQTPMQSPPLETEDHKK